MQHDHINWQQYIDLCERLVARVAESGWEFDSLLCLARGGMRPGDFFSRIYSKPLAIMTTSSYREAAGTVQGDLDIAKYITGVSDLKGKLLLVDDLCDSGKTIQKVVEHLKKNYPAITEIRVAVIWVKACSVFHPDYHAVEYKDAPWIHQPFEVYDDLGPAKHLEKCREKYGDQL